MRVVTYNIHHGVGPDRRLDLSRVAAAVSAYDVVGLQEVDRRFSPRSRFVDQPAVLGRAVGAEALFGACRGVPGRVPGQYGNALLTRLPVLSWCSVPLPRPPGTEQRGVVEALVATGGTPVLVLVTHLQHNSAAARRTQAAALADRVAASDRPVVLLGDLNAEPDGDELAPLADVLVDAGGAAGPTFPSWAPRQRIDAVLVSPGIRVLSAAVLTAAAGSDHLPLSATLELPGAAAPAR